MPESSVSTRDGADGLWKLRIQITVGVVLLFAAAWVAELGYVVSRSPRSMITMERAAHTALPLIPTGGVDLFKLNPQGLHYPVDVPLPVSNGDGTPALDQQGRPVGYWVMARRLSGGAASPWLLFHMAACAMATILVWLVGRPRLLNIRAHSPLYVLTTLMILAELSALPAMLLLWSVYPVRFFWAAGWYNAPGAAWLNVGSLSRSGPGIAAGLLYIAFVLWLARRIVLRTALRHGLAASVGSVAGSTRCQTCGYEVGTLAPCPECGVAEPQAMPAGLYFGMRHARLARSRWRWIVLAAVVIGAILGYGLPLLIGTLRVIPLL